MSYWNTNICKSSGSTGPKAPFSIVLLDIYWTYKCYTPILSKIDQQTFSAAPLLWPVPCNHSWAWFKLGRTDETYLQRMFPTPHPHNEVHWGHPFETPSYTEVRFWLRGYIQPGHYTMSLVQVGAMYREVFWAITYIKNKKKPQHNLCAAPNCHPGVRSYCGSASPFRLYKILTLYALPTLLRL